MGKDNIPFHTVMFPCSLLGTGDPYLKLHHISTTDYLTYEGALLGMSLTSATFPDDDYYYYSCTMTNHIQ